MEDIVKDVISYLEFDTGNMVLWVSDREAEIGDFKIKIYDNRLVLTSSLFPKVLPSINYENNVWKIKFFSEDFSAVPYKPILREFAFSELEDIFSFIFVRDGEFKVEFVNENVEATDIKDMFNKIQAPAIEPSSYSYMQITYNSEEFPGKFIRVVRRLRKLYSESFPKKKEHMDRFLDIIKPDTYVNVGGEWVEAKTPYGKMILSREVGKMLFGVFLETWDGNFKNRFRISKGFGNAPFVNGAIPDMSGEYVFLGYDTDIHGVVKILEESGKEYVPIEFETLSEKEEKIINLLNKYGSVMLVGPPGTGKTFTARKIARYIAGTEGENWILVQSSPSFEYENFVEGIKPVEASGIINFKVVEGPFLKILNRALGSPSRKFVVIIDEINRGNVASLLGELLYALEYRDSPVIRVYSSKPLVVPRNLYIITTLNEKDSSVVKVDQAILRRFPVVFFEPSEDELRRFLNEKGWKNEDIIKVVEIFRNVQEITGNSIGHTYFFAEDMEELREKLEHFVKPLLRIHFSEDIDFRA